MSVIRNEVRRATYLDSIVLMRMSREIAALAGVEEAGLIMGTPAKSIAGIVQAGLGPTVISPMARVKAVACDARPAPT